MSFEKQVFGDGATNVVSNVSALYGTRSQGGVKGKTQGFNTENEIILDFDNTDSPLYDQVFVPLDAEIMDIREVDVTGTAVVKVGEQVVTACRLDDDSTWVTITTAADVAVTGVTAGKIVVKYRHITS